MDKARTEETPEAEAFFLREADGWLRATGLTRGPWSADHQHGGPPAALCARAIERLQAELDPDGAAALHPARLAVDFARPVPIGRLRARAQVVSRGRRVERYRAHLEREDGTAVCHLDALCIRRAPVVLPPIPGPPGPPPAPHGLPPFVFPFFRASIGYHTALEVRIARGTFGGGAVAAWTRIKVPLVLGEAPSPLQRVMASADSGHGVSIVLRVEDYTFVNPDLTVSLHRLPASEWVCLDARTVLEAEGVGLADVRLCDERGAIGRSTQTLVVARR